MKIIAGSIDLNKIDKSRIVAGKNGAKYYNVSILINDTKDQYGNDVSIIESQTKEERAAKAQRKFLGNGKTVYESTASAEQSQNTFTPYTDQMNSNNELPF